MNNSVNNFLRKIDIYDHIKIFKDRYFENPIETEHRKKLMVFYKNFIKPGDLCFDIGASYGNRSETFLKLGAKVVAVEPQFMPFRYLKRKFKDSISIENKGVSSENKKMEMIVSSHSALSSFSPDWVNTVSQKRFQGISWDKKIEIDVITLDSLIKKYGIPDFCKIDVEGHELEVLKGLTKSIKYISFEFTIPEFREKVIECINLLSNLGDFLCNFSDGEKLELNLTEWLSKEDFIEFFKNLNDPNLVDGDIYIKFF